MIGFSVADLIKQSARQILYLREHPNKKRVTPEQLRGVEEQKKQTLSQYAEMRGSYTRNTIKIFFSIDEIRVESKQATLIEHKSGEYNDWYFNKAVQQTGAYHALALLSSRQFETSVFYVNQGNPRQMLDLTGVTLKSELNFIGTVYTVKVSSAEGIIKLLYDKALATLSWETANAFNEARYSERVRKLIKVAAHNSVG